MPNSKYSDEQKHFNGRVPQKHAKKDHREPYTQEPWLDLFCTA